MNFQREWWEKTYEQIKSSTVLTKPEERKLLLQKIKELEQGKPGKAYLKLQQEKANAKKHVKDLQQELENLQADYDKITEQNQEQREQIKTLQEQIQKLDNNCSEINNLIQQKLQEQKQEYEKELNHATSNQSYLLKTSLFTETENRELKEQLALLNSSETDQQRELKERGKLIAKLEENAKESQKELEFANSKIKQLNPLFSRVLAVIKKNVILRGKKDLKETIASIQELMNWEKSPLVTETNTPTGETEKENEKLAELKAQLLKSAKEAAQAKKEAEQSESLLLAEKAKLAKAEKAQQELKEQFLQQKRTELETVLTTTKKPTTQLRREVKQLEAIAEKAQQELKEQLANLQTKEKPKAPKYSTWTEEPEAVPKPLTEKEKKWRNISLKFTEETINQWENQDFTFNQADEWVDKVGLSVQDADYAHWLATEVKLEPLKYLNETSPEDQANLREQFKEYKSNKK